MARNLNVLLFLNFLVLCGMGCARRNPGKKGDHFPTYEEMRAKGVDIYSPTISRNPDGLLPDGQQSVRIIRIPSYQGAFELPADSVVYFLNNRKVKSQKKAKKEIEAMAEDVGQISIGDVGPGGKRAVRIEYVPRPVKD
ncbi:hypothetical protein LZD49_28825 [Dyadobacter sp. CY261]|uniref:hypothetical protein n=1 Tax=Dyadobacter sp. CY261 TaxID=2907203 RepID=UPI001F24A8E2|nr:hypothetical protein [Dyadobacter sp. CY261]MCF0074524.1 hypothetical protein [Dyadobacter sp. CY261]